MHIQDVLVAPRSRAREEKPGRQTKQMLNSKKRVGLIYLNTRLPFGERGVPLEVINAMSHINVDVNNESEFLVLTVPKHLHPFKSDW